MNVIITDRFKKEYLNWLRKYFTQEDLVNILLEKQHTYISLHEPFFKFKNNINLISFRWWLAILDNQNIIPLFLFLKKDKNYWENISWKNNKKLIEYEYGLAVWDIENWNFEQI